MADPYRDPLDLQREITLAILDGQQHHRAKRQHDAQVADQWVREQLPSVIKSNTAAGVHQLTLTRDQLDAMVRAGLVGGAGDRLPGSPLGVEHRGGRLVLSWRIP